MLSNLILAVVRADILQDGQGRSKVISVVAIIVPR